MENQIRTHRVGSITSGLSMIAFGVIYAAHLFTDAISFEFIIKLWPFMIIGLGIELLISNARSEKIVYDKAAIFLMILVTFFAMGMAGVGMGLEIMEAVYTNYPGN